MTVSRDHSKAIYQGIKSAGIHFLTALPETWLVYLRQLADDPAMTPVEIAKEEAIGIATGAYFAGARNALLKGRGGRSRSLPHGPGAAGERIPVSSGRVSRRRSGD